MQIDEQYLDATAPVGEPVRYLHNECTSSKKDPCLIVTRTGRGWTYICHRCGLRGFAPITGAPASKILAFAQSSILPQQMVDKVELPPQTSEVPQSVITRVHAWMGQYGITGDEVARCRIYISANHLLVFPVYDDHQQPIFWIGRNFNTAHPEPKWLSQRRLGRRDIYFRPYRNPTSDRVALVEDAVSALRVSRVIDAVGLLGSYIPDSLVHSLAQTYRVIFLWLDADKAAYSLRRVARYRSFGYPVRYVYTERDPKVYSEAQVQKILEKSLRPLDK
jgi:hypothetical protein